MKPFYEDKHCAVQSFEAGNMEFSEHLHDHVEVLLVLEGRIGVRIMEQSRELGAGDCAVIFPQQIHSYRTPRESRVRLFIFHGFLAGMYLRSLQKCVPSCPFLAAGELPEDGLLALDRLYALSSTGGEEEGRLCSAWVQVLFAVAWPVLLPVKRQQSGNMELTCQLIQYVMEHFQEPLTLDILARELHVNKYYISNLFSNRLGSNFRQYLNRIRLEYAMQLMQSSKAPLTDVWAEAGFNSQRSFNRTFSDIMGMSPGQYRKAVSGSTGASGSSIPFSEREESGRTIQGKGCTGCPETETGCKKKGEL